MACRGRCADRRRRRVKSRRLPRISTEYPPDQWHCNSLAAAAPAQGVGSCCEIHRAFFEREAGGAPQDRRGHAHACVGGGPMTSAVLAAKIAPEGCGCAGRYVRRTRTSCCEHCMRRSATQPPGITAGPRGTRCVCPDRCNRLGRSSVPATARLLQRTVAARTRWRRQRRRRSSKRHARLRAGRDGINIQVT